MIQFICPHMDWGGIAHESSFEFVQPNINRAAKDTKQAEPKPLKVLIRIKKSEMVTCFCYIRSVYGCNNAITDIGKETRQRRIHQSPFEIVFGLSYIFFSILTEILTENIVIWYNISALSKTVERLSSTREYKLCSYRNLSGNLTKGGHL